MREAFEAGVVADAGPAAGVIAGVVPAAGGLAGGVPEARAGAGPAAGGIAGVRPAAGIMAAPHGSMTTVNAMREGYLAHRALADAAARATALRERGPFKPSPVDPFKAGPGDIMVFADMLERCLKLETTITVARYYGNNEELGMAYFLSVFTGDAASLARTALADTPLSDDMNFRLHGAVLALLRAYLPPIAGKELRLACARFAFPASFARGWTELVRLYDLQCAIAELTAEDAHYVKGLDPPSWGRFLQIMEDAVDDSPSQTWIVSVLYSTAAQNVTTRAAMKSLLTANDPGGVVTVGGTLNAIARVSRPVEVS